MVDLDDYRDGWRERWETEARLDAVRAREARALLPRLVAALVERWGATRVVLVGSLLRGDFHRGSDLDLVAWGIPADQWLYALADLDRLGGDFEVDLVPFESATSSMRRDADDGEVLHGEP